MTDKEKESIERLKYINMAYDCNNYYSRYDLDCIETVLNLIQTQQAEIEKKDNEKQIHIKLEQQYKKEYLDTKEELKKKDKIIDEMSEQLTTPLHSKEWVKEYYERKVENGN